MKEDKLNIDELLNGFIDDELTKRQEVEVRRLINHDQKVAQRLREIQQCKVLVNSLPCAEPPPHLLGDIKIALETKTYLKEPEEFVCSKHEGVRHLFFRKVLTTAAMIGLLAVLAGVIYSIIAPGTTTRKTIVGKDWQLSPQSSEQIDSQTPKLSVAKSAQDDLRFDGRIVLKTGNLVAVDSFVTRAVIDNGLLQDTELDSVKDRTVYVINCSRRTLQLLMADLKNIWQQCGSTTLFVETDHFAETIAVEKVSPDQIIQIAALDTIKKRTQTAKDLAILNSLNEFLPGSSVFAALQTTRPTFLTVPKPVLTSSDSIELKQQRPQKTDIKNVHFTIVIEESI